MISLGIVIIIMIVGNTSENEFVFEKYPSFNRGHNYINLDSIIRSNNISNIDSLFPYEKYLGSDNWKTVDGVRKDLSILDSLKIDPNTTNNIIATTLTSNLRMWDNQNLDSLNLLLGWAEKFNPINVASDNHKIVYQSVFNFWGSEISKKLQDINASNSSARYSYKFNYLQMRCCELRFGCGGRDDGLTKIVKYFIEKKWFYLAKRAWFGTSWIPKLIIITFIISVIYGYICIFQKHLKTKKNGK